MDLKTYISTERGRAVSLAARLGVSPSYLSQMANGKSPISPERCVDIWRETGGVVTREHLRPDDWRRIWPELASAHDVGSSAQGCETTIPDVELAPPMPKRRASDQGGVD
ncbi:MULTISPECIES: YdaS family helix-turn-helix protein [unclassified Massilia]|uniref:transcriptional regulator n=1 Tax=unclassified Massilia TaxID=2609279 RepID=UPI0017824217|nr:MULTISPECIES: YdaS family helix-turn-helix protein [unclassified Massilia]MBD8531474.1 helix-turn-helix domain-containing protein [Massilia sp. CFBP 13647]MBD8673730.1 helix-turn-helix domain-containing protein [Massilia sp. CFBP 13721]